MWNFNQAFHFQWLLYVDCSRIVRFMQYDYKYYAVVVEIFIGTQDDGESIDP